MGFVFCLGIAFAQEHMQEMTEEEKAWMEYMTPVDAHKILEKSMGEWNAKTYFWTQPGTEPMVDEGKAVNEMIYGGRYLSMKQKGMSFGMPYEGMGIMDKNSYKMEMFALTPDGKEFRSFLMEYTR
jgi:hypothetical protein